MTPGRRLLALLLASVLAVGAPNASAWNDAAHMVAALIAYDQLPVEARAAAARLLHEHPRFHEDFEPRLPRNLIKAGAAAQDRWYFAFAATWPDEARRFDRAPAASRDALVARYHHGSWHYINLPIYLRESDRPKVDEQAPPMRWSADLPDEHLNLVQALEMLTQRWCAASQTNAERALAMSWIEHLVADLHQPLHAAALIGAPEFAHGDRGGNDILVVGGSNLHALWDGALGDDRRLWHLDTLARDYGLATASADHTAVLSSDLQTGAVFQAWAKASRLLASDVAYSADVRAAAMAATDTHPADVRIGAAYRAALVATTERQIGLAGHRIALVLQVLPVDKSDAACSRQVH